VDGACTEVGCKSDEDCHMPAQCVAAGRGFHECRFVCESAQDCAEAALVELGLDEPVPSDPWNYASAWTCRAGVCEGKQPGCNVDEDCYDLFGTSVRCKLP
jgi:hypothetical protein